MHVSPDEADDIVCNGFEAAWIYYDPNNEGKIEADRMPRFFRQVAGMHLNLQ